ncbi:hypothetical protein PF005_g28807 [Phytophthora fragariae]|uniref:Uncharacterized protein n=1 Tax=Phytophthora fragariae TaxID=53985 RepID=A0A6A3SXA7_9STRA|nr:hypothetical protein PF003_g21468 [Phytophthora fragariae]KAE8932062.1 hypothetical protein PF009_g17898 [Phytophthora fragariae]KAE8991801.1 hypothetical protein PF011_g17794 [Phytophthora fragariae]KAE9090885.1 hypothetical protein PF007_g19072 [Phytophthora fragariae]KAE9092213.1 hypothetical protein PF010_g17888 [Phytophthora fragariae]
MASVAALPTIGPKTSSNHKHWQKREFFTDDEANTTATMVGGVLQPGVPAAGFGPWKKVLTSEPSMDGWFTKVDYWEGYGAHKDELPYESGIYEVSLQLPDGHAIGRTDRVVIYAGKAEHTKGSSGLRKRILTDYGGKSGGGGNFPNKARPYIELLPITGFGPGGFHVYWRWMEIGGDDLGEINKNTEAAELRLLNEYDYALTARDNPPQRPALWRKVADAAENYVAILAHLEALSTDNTAAAAAAPTIAAVDDDVDGEDDDKNEASGEYNDEDGDLDEADQAAIDQIAKLVDELNITDRAKRTLRRSLVTAQ